jgi:ketosteroid isomerase-like protein
MMKQTIFLTATLFICSTVFSQSDEKANILAVEKNTADAFTKHNVVGLNQAFTDNATIISAKGQIITKQQMSQYVQNINSVTVSDMQVNIKGTIAIVTGTVIQTGKNDAGPYTDKCRYTDVLEKIKGQWYIIASQSTPVAEE